MKLNLIEASELVWKYSQTWTYDPLWKAPSIFLVPI